MDVPPCFTHIVYLGYYGLMEQVILTRRQLYELVWKEPMTTLSKRYAVSGAALRQECINMHIPYPKAGHWEKIKWGKPVIIEAFNETHTGQQNITLLIRDREDNSISNYSPLVIRQKEIEKDPRLSLVVPSKLTNPDKLIIAARDILDNKGRKDYRTGMLSTDREGAVAITVSPQFIGRALRFMDTMIKALRIRGHKVYINHWETCVIVSEQEFKICFRERATRVSSLERSRNTELRPTGILYFKATRYVFQKEWQDKTFKLEEQISRIIATMEIEGERRKTELDYHHKQQAIREEKEQIQRGIEQQKAREIEDFRELLREAKLWGQINTLRDYIDALEAKAIANNALTEELVKWIESTRQNARKYDPIEERLKRNLPPENIKST